MHLLLILSTLAAAPPPPTAASDAADTAIVCPEEFLPTLRPWLVHRAAQGHRFALISNEESPEAILTKIRDFDEDSRGGCRGPVAICVAG
jgi:hypothetical protein